MTVKPLLKHAFYYGGGLAMVKLRNAKRNRAISYHHFSGIDSANFDRQCDFLRREYNPVSFDNVADFVSKRKPLPRNSVAVTIDDGYRDFLLHGFPALKRHGIPATVFLMTNFLDGVEWPWWNRVAYAFEQTPLGSVTISIANSRPAVHDLSDSAAKHVASEQTTKALKSVPNRQRLCFLSRLPELLRVEVPVHPPTELQPMSWNEVRELSAQGISFGAHTKSHPILSSVETEEQLRDEIQGSQDRIREELGIAPVHFCYPKGHPEDIDDRVERIVKASRFRTGVSSQRGLNVMGSNPYVLKRLPMDPGAREHYFQQQFAGFRA